MTALYTLSEHCEYGALLNELIRDRIVVGIRDKNLSEKLQLDADLTLTKVIERVRLSEVVKEQQEKLIEKDSVSVNAISPNKPAKFLKQKPSSGIRKQNVKPDFHRKNNENESRLHGKCKCGADHTVLPANVSQNVFQNAKLEPPDNILCGPDRNPLKTLGKFNTNIEYKGKSCTEEIYVISNLQTCLLGKPALFSLGLGPNLDSICQISAADPKAKFPELFKGLGKEIVRRRCIVKKPPESSLQKEELEAEIDAFIQMITSSLPASSRRLDELRVAQRKHETCHKLTDYVLKGWPSKEVHTLCAPCW
ncbi:hypothetical protein AVEN_150747-1 [Araneus ventricosus]|uniref:Uncharacterized protein n=1 Tax=Araneus ventricosus TaxID=182803 RepID=A0A4Y2EYZ6_ARAVE|nr:hypothetical protein AVEN_150747-1 [Araneus ventricosus]